MHIMYQRLRHEFILASLRAAKFLFSFKQVILALYQLILYSVNSLLTVYLNLAKMTIDEVKRTAQQQVNRALKDHSRFLLIL